ncbi:PREDICTED: putative pentatricopeptide repeat-containing protein At5g59200, chloroplastic [Nelumbo nucifera]|uniref:DYW domain-containing protein n=2 Tax=Nelumbo nucifera TaxID=4432 RepID=A0A822Y1S0_NELNU|nr:PREDICTED: putative pentatricopeptide repeat-containing protein At5g59200, chloroplastic [Nelumbo nucifera]DAD25239.1 TPA_asm: hypothetical protein HUJ06_026703 [Nelumbo nucifera]
MGSLTLVAASTSPFLPYSNSNRRNSDDRYGIITQLQKCRNISEVHPLHARIIRNGHEQDPFVLFEMIRLCFNHNSMDYATKVFNQIEDPNVYLFTALIDGYVSTGAYLDGIRAYSRMVGEFVEPDPYAITSILKACGYKLALKEGREVHGRVLKLQLNSNRLVRMKLMEFYGKCGEFRDARQVFDEMPEGDVVASTVMISCYVNHGLINDAYALFYQVPVKDTVCWTAMIDGFVRNGEMNKALELFREMQRDGVRPNEVTIVCVLSSCSQLGALELGKWIHSYVGKYNIKLNQFVRSALISMYSRCGSLDEAQKLFVEMVEKDVVTYNSMIVGLAMHGRSSEAIELFQEMVKQGLKPTYITFVGVLNACSHGGLVDLGFKIFHSMTRDYGIEPRIEHYGCMVDLLGRVGHLEEAYDFIGRMRVAPDHIIWGALLSACKIHGNLKLGELAAKILVEGGAADSGTYVLLSNVYASSGKWEEAARVRAKMKESGIQKEPGCSSIEVNNEIHEFLLGDLKHPQREAVYKKLEELNIILKSEGYSPATEEVLQDIGDGEKEWALAIHSERLAICYGLISTKPRTTLRIVKNLRVCNDCHSMIKLIAKITQRKIVVRDRNRFHHFEDGSCSCGDYW